MMKHKRVKSIPNESEIIINLIWKENKKKERKKKAKSSVPKCKFILYTIYMFDPIYTHLLLYLKP